MRKLIYWPAQKWLQQVPSSQSIHMYFLFAHFTTIFYIFQFYFQQKKGKKGKSFFFGHLIVLLRTIHNNTWWWWWWCLSCGAQEQKTKFYKRHLEVHVQGEEHNSVYIFFFPKLHLLIFFFCVFFFYVRLGRWKILVRSNFGRQKEG